VKYLSTGILNVSYLAPVLFVKKPARPLACPFINVWAIATRTDLILFIRISYGNNGRFGPLTVKELNP